MIDGVQHLRVALAHDWLVAWRGGERVLDRLARLFGPAPLYTLVARGPAATPAIARCRIVTSPLQHWPGAAGRFRRAYLPLLPWATSRLRVEPCDLLISTSSAAIKSLRPPESTPHLCYCHSPPRYIWEQTADYAVGRGGWSRGVALSAARPLLRRWDRATAGRVTRFLANSAHTAARIERCYGREARVVHPPVDTGFFTPADVTREDWLLVVAALEPYKRTDLAIAAANAAGFPLKVVGTGSQLPALRRQAGPTVSMLGPVDGRTLRELYRRTRALVFPQLEDFGIAAVEAQATGCPVIAYGQGGALDTVTEETGVLLKERTPEAIAHAVATLGEFDPHACRRNAERFAPEVFDAAMLEVVGEVVGERFAGGAVG